MAKKVEKKKAASKVKAVKSVAGALTELTNAIDDLQGDGVKFDDGGRGWSPAGTRIRKGLQEVVKAAQTLRKGIQEKKNSMKE